MTREEAIQIINGEVGAMSERENEALDMAVRSLEAWDKVLKSFKFLYQFGKIEEYTIDIINQHLEEVQDEQIH